jgi:hypothetical protein
MAELRAHFWKISAFFRAVPSPVQGTSQRTRSKNAPRSAEATATAGGAPPYSSAAAVAVAALDMGAVVTPSPLTSTLGKCWASWHVTTSAWLPMPAVEDAGVSPGKRASLSDVTYDGTGAQACKHDSSHCRSRQPCPSQGAHPSLLHNDATPVKRWFQRDSTPNTCL